MTAANVPTNNGAFTASQYSAQSCTSGFAFATNYSPVTLILPQLTTSNNAGTTQNQYYTATLTAGASVTLATTGNVFMATYAGSATVRVCMILRRAKGCYRPDPSLMKYPSLSPLSHIYIYIPPAGR